MWVRLKVWGDGVAGGSMSLIGVRKLVIGAYVNPP